MLSPVKITVTSVRQGLVPRLFVSALTVSTPFTTCKAIKKGETSTIKEWLQSEGTKANEYRGGRAFPRHHAVADGTALHWAVYYGQLEITQLLLDNGAGTICNLVTNKHCMVQVQYLLVQIYKIFTLFFC